MDESIQVKPLPRKTRQLTFLLLIMVFVVAIPLLYLYATGYRLDLQKPSNFVSTGGISVTINEQDAQMFIDDEEVRAARTFRRAFYAQGIDVGTHRISVQKEGFHTWVKELPVSERLVTETIAFNLPLVPQVRVISEWQSATGSAIIATPITNASTTNEVLATTTKNTKAFVRNPEYAALIEKFATTTIEEIHAINSAYREKLKKTPTTTPEQLTTEVATTTISRGDVRLHESGVEIFATWTGSFEQMPYYYCAPEFPRYSSSTATTTEQEDKKVAAEPPRTVEVETEFVMHPVQTIPDDAMCKPTIRIDRKWQTVRDFDFFPGNTDFVITALGDVVNVVEIDGRAWQNVQPLFYETNLKLYVENDSVYVYDGTTIYEILAELE